MDQLVSRAIVNWDKNPVPGSFFPSAGGLIALADLSTISRRTAIAGGSSWLDALLLAPGLHYQQAADALAAADGSPASYDALELLPGKTTLYSITNPATVRYLQSVARTGQDVVVNVGSASEPRSWLRGARRRERLGPGMSRVSYKPTVDIGWFSHVLYLASPVLTAASLVFMALLEDWWGVGLLVALMFSRILNIWVIKQRSKAPSRPLPLLEHSSFTDGNAEDNFLTEYIVTISSSPNTTVRLRGLSSDLKVIATSSWLSTRTHVQGYLEAAAKLVVYLVAAFSGQLSQIGALIFMALLLVTAGLLGMSNAHAKHMQMHGRIAVSEDQQKFARVRSSLSARGSPSNMPFVSHSISARRRSIVQPRQRLAATELSGRSDDSAITRVDHGKSPDWPASIMSHRSSSSDLHQYLVDLAEKGQASGGRA